MVFCVCVCVCVGERERETKSAARKKKRVRASERKENETGGSFLLYTRVHSHALHGTHEKSKKEIRTDNDIKKEKGSGLLGGKEEIGGGG